MGYQVKLISPQFVKPFVKGNKNDTNDAQAIVEAAMRPTMRFVPLKTVEQQDMQSLHRARSLAIKNRTGYANQIRGLLAEYGVIIPQGIRYVRSHISSILEDEENGLTSQIREIVEGVYEQLKQVDKAINDYDKKISQQAQSNEACRRIMRLAGIGPVVATAMISAIGDGKTFRCGREVSAWLGLTPRHRASGQRTVMQGISKRGDCYLRTLVIHGSRSALRYCQNKQDKKSQWAQDKLERLGSNKAAVALANKTVREIWAVLKKGEQFIYAS